MLLKTPTSLSLFGMFSYAIIALVILYGIGVGGLYVFMGVVVNLTWIGIALHLGLSKYLPSSYPIFFTTFLGCALGAFALGEALNPDTTILFFLAACCAFITCLWSEISTFFARTWISFMPVFFMLIILSQTPNPTDLQFSILGFFLAVFMSLLATSPFSTCIKTIPSNSIWETKLKTCLRALIAILSTGVMMMAFSRLWLVFIDIDENKVKITIAITVYTMACSLALRLSTILNGERFFLRRHEDAHTADILLDVLEKQGFQGDAILTWGHSKQFGYFGVFHTMALLTYYNDQSNRINNTTRKWSGKNKTSLFMGAMSAHQKMRVINMLQSIKKGNISFQHGMARCGFAPIDNNDAP